MRLITYSFNDKREATKFINEHGIAKEDIVTFFLDNDGTYTLMYYGK